MNQLNYQQIREGMDFKLIRILKYDKILDFVFEHIRVRTFSSVFYLVINSLYLGLLLGFSVEGFISGQFHAGTYLVYLVLAILAGSFLVIPFHEGLHGIAYKLMGAPKIHFGADMKQMLFFVAADKYVLGRKGFYLVAIFPFLVINVITLVALVFLHRYWFIGGMTFLFLHNIMCIGDFAMISYFQVNPKRELYTFDDHKEKISYIYEKVSPA